MSVRSTKTPFRYMKQFKAIAMDYEYFASLSDEGQLYCLSEQQVYIILAQLDYVGWLTRWYNTDDITQTTVDRIKSDLMEAVMSCVDVQILVDQANENLVTTVTNRALQSQGIRDVLEARYDGTPTSINPDAPTTTWSYSGTDDGKDALCAALMAFVYSSARAQADSVRAGQIGGLAAIGLVAALLIPGLNIFFLVGAGVAVLLGAGVVGVTTSVAIAALTDITALNAVVCYMKDTLEDESVSAATWGACLTTYPFATGSNAAIVADFLKACLSDNYLTFLDFMGTGYVGVTTGEAVPECPCDDPVYGFIVYGVPGTTTVVQAGNTYTITKGFLGGGGAAYLYVGASLNGVLSSTTMTYTSLGVFNNNISDEWGNGGGSYITDVPTSAPPPDVWYAGAISTAPTIASLQIVITTEMPFQGVVSGA